MKRCPTCDKTFEDNLKFCQADGTPLVEDAPPADPYATMVGNQADFKIPPVEEVKDPPAVEEQQGATEDEEDVLEVPEAEEFDPMKTMVAGGDTASNVKVDVPDSEPKDPAPPAPEPPKFEEPEVAPPDLTGGLSEDDISSAEPESIDTPPPSPFDDDSKSDDAPSAPIPSPFDQSMPPGFTPPDTPPFDPTEPVKAEKVASVPSSPTVDEPEPLEDSNPSLGVTENVAPPPSPMEVVDSALEENSSGVSVESPEGENKTLAIISMACGILSMLCCFSIITGPAAVITGFMARSKINESPGEYGGGTFALVGMITGLVGIILFIGLLILQLVSGSLLQLG